MPGPTHRRALRPSPARHGPAAGFRRARVPRQAQPARRSIEISPAAPSSAAARARSSPGPTFRRSAGARFAVIRRSGKSKPQLINAARTRSRASRTAASGRPTIWNTGRPRWTSTSTRTGRAEIPSRVKAVVSASMEAGWPARPRAWRADQAQDRAELPSLLRRALRPYGRSMTNPPPDDPPAAPPEPRRDLRAATAARGLVDHRAELADPGRRARPDRPQGPHPASSSRSRRPTPACSGPTSPALAVGPNKQRRLRKLASAWIADAPRCAFHEVRFDVSASRFNRDGRRRSTSSTSRPPSEPRSRSGLAGLAAGESPTRLRTRAGGAVRSPFATIAWRCSSLA